MGHNFMVALLSGLMMGVLIAIIVIPSVLSRKWGAERDFRKALEGRAKTRSRARFEPSENLAAFRKVLDAQLNEPLTEREVSAIRSVAPEMAVCIEYEVGRLIREALSSLERQISVGRDEWWRSPELAERERKRFAERARALQVGAKDVGECPACGFVVPLNASNCSECRAEFGAQSAWSVRPLA